MVDALGISSNFRDASSIVHQTGDSDHARVKSAYEYLGIEAEVVPFLFDMPQALKSADLVVSRSGAGTLAELAASGKPSILIPFPYATHNHQEKKCQSYAGHGGGIGHSRIRALWHTSG